MDIYLFIVQDIKVKEKKKKNQIKENKFLKKESK